MKKIILVLISFMMMGIVNAKTTIDKIEYTILEDDTIQIDGYSGTLTSLVIPEIIEDKQVTKIKEAAFYGCKLSSVSIPSGIKEISRGAFADCKSLTTVDLKEGVEIISDYAFQNTIISSLELPTSLKMLKNGIFYGNSKIKTINIPKNVTSLSGNFAYNSNLESITVAEENPYFQSINGVLFNKDQSILYIYPAGKNFDNYEIPSGTTEIEKYAFSYNRNLKSIHIPNTIQIIREGAFYNTYQLKTIEIPSSVISIGSLAFENSQALESAVIHSNLSNTSYKMFADSPKLKRIDFNGKIKRVTMYLVYSNNEIEYINFNNEVQIIENSAISKCPKIAFIKIPSSVEFVEGDFVVNSNSSVQYQIPSNLTQTKAGNYVLLESINKYGGEYNYDYAKEVLELVNTEREKLGLNKISLDLELTESAMLRAREIDTYFEHKRLTGESCFTVNEKASGENIAIGQGNPNSVMNSWMNSSGHKANILGKSYKSIGIGAYKNKNGSYHWVQLFSTQDAVSTMDKEGMIKQEDYTEKVQKSLISDISIRYNNTSMKEEESLYPSKTYLQIGDYLTEVKPNTINWSSNNKDIASVDENGRIYGLKMGQANIIGQKAGKTSKISVNILNKYDISLIVNNVDYSSVFDFDYYIKNNPDVAKAYKTDNSYNYQKVFNHFVNVGMKEGRRGNENFNVYIYQANYVDLYQTFKSDLKRYYNHFCVSGKKENRNASTLNFIYLRDNKDYSKIFDFEYYISHNSDVKNSFKKFNSFDYMGIFNHFITTGMKEGRKGNETFNVYIYEANYTDLYNAYGHNLPIYYNHYAGVGYKEGRNASSLNFVYQRSGKDYSKVFDINYYIEQYKDVANAYKKKDGYNYIGVYNHFVNLGMKEGRKGNNKFDVIVYKNQNGDLRNAFQNNLTKYYNHYMSIGFKEGRVCL
ncbi:MAG: leucine-rich repeat protein [Bacilli bacterium]|nr:leucine-rich repeat protein [Bacilli bacterium]